MNLYHINKRKIEQCRRYQIIWRIKSRFKLQPYRIRRQLQQKRFYSVSPWSTFGFGTLASLTELPVTAFATLLAFPGLAFSFSRAFNSVHRSVILLPHILQKRKKHFLTLFFDVATSRRRRHFKTNFGVVDVKQKRH